MLDDENPASADIVAAARQMDMILQLCKLITRQRTSAKRQYTLRISEPAFAALRWLNAGRFGNSADITAAIAETEKRAIDLAAMPTDSSSPLSWPLEHCPACGEELTKPNKYETMSYCRKCLGTIMTGYGRLDQLFGTWAI
jgi:hypothetical protein